MSNYWPLAPVFGLIVVWAGIAVWVGKRYELTEQEKEAFLADQEPGLVRKVKTNRTWTTLFSVAADLSFLYVISVMSNWWLSPARVGQNVEYALFIAVVVYFIGIAMQLHGKFIKAHPSRTLKSRSTR